MTEPTKPEVQTPSEFVSETLKEVTQPLNAEGTHLIAAALAKAQEAFAPLAKNRTAKIPTKAGGSYSYKYADLADVIESVKAALAQNEIAHSQSIKEAEKKLWLVTTLYHSSGQSIASQIPFVWSDKDGRPQELGSAMTYMRRYGLCAAVDVAADEDDDGQAAQTAATSKATTPPPIEKGGKVAMISEPQRKKFFALCKQKGVENPKVFAWDSLGEACCDPETKAVSTKAITMADAQKLFKALEKMPDVPSKGRA